MALWGNNDREQSKPTWLSPQQARAVIRTSRGWELPLGIGFKGFTAGQTGPDKLNSSTWIPTELLVACPLDPSPTGVTQTNYTSRITDLTGGTTGRGYTSLRSPSVPYFTVPVTGDSMTAYNLSFSAGTATPQFIRFVVQSGNLVNNALLGNFTFTGPFNDSGTQAGFTGWSMLTGPTAYFNYGATNGVLNYPKGYTGFGGLTTMVGAGVLKIVSGSAGTYNTTLRVFDGTLTGSVRFIVSLF